VKIHTKHQYKQLRQHLIDRRLTDEMHHLFWSAPFDNNGRRDEGWHCREHAMATAVVASLLGHTAILCWGRLALIGMTNRGRALLDISTHSWAMIEGFGIADLSLNLGERSEAGWLRWPASCAVGNDFFPPKKVQYSYFTQEQREQFQQSVARATSQQDSGATTWHAIYFGERWAPLSKQLLQEAPRIINSPLTDELRAMCAEDHFYPKAFVHCWAVLNRQTRPLTSISKMAAWSAIVQMDIDALGWIVRRANLPECAAADLSLIAPNTDGGGQVAN